MTAFSVSDFSRDVGSDYSRDSATSHARAKTRPDEARDRASPDDVRKDRVSDFDKALRAQESDEPVRPRSERAPESLSGNVNERPKEIVTQESARVEESDVAAPGIGDAKSAAKLDSLKSKPVGEQAEPQLSAKDAIFLPDFVQVVSAGSVASPFPEGGVAADEKTDGASTRAIQTGAIVLDEAAQTQAQNLLAVLAAGAPAPQQGQLQAPAVEVASPQAPVADPLANLNAGQAGQKPDVQSQTGAHSNSQIPASVGAQSDVTTPPVSAFEANVTAAPTSDAKSRRTSDQTTKAPDASAQGAAAIPASTAQNAGQPVAALQSALKAAAAQSPQDAKAPDMQIAEIKSANSAQLLAFAAQLDTQSSQTAPQAGGAAQASPNATAIAQNVVRFFRETGSGNAHFDIRLDPVELGRVDARVEINKDKTVTLTLSAERPETLAELIRTARDLERQLTDSGVKLSEDGLKFRLNSDARGDAQHNMQGGSEGRRPARSAYGAGAESALQAEAAIPIRSWRASGVDVWA